MQLTLQQAIITLPLLSFNSIWVYSMNGRLMVLKSRDVVTDDTEMRIAIRYKTICGSL